MSAVFVPRSRHRSRILWPRNILPPKQFVLQLRAFSLTQTVHMLSDSGSTHQALPIALFPDFTLARYIVPKFANCIHKDHTLSVFCLLLSYAFAVSLGVFQSCKQLE